MSKKILKEKFPTAKIKKVLFGDCDYELSIDNITYHIKLLNVNKHTILSINSKHIWQVKIGKAIGINFKTSSSKLIDLKSFNKLPNKIICFKDEPYKILRFINESEVVDISDTKAISDIKIYNSLKEITV